MKLAARQLVASLALGVGAGLAYAQPVVIVEDDFEAQDLDQALIGNDWKFQLMGFTDAGCQTYQYVYPDNPIDAENRSYFTVTPGGGGIGSIYDNYNWAGLSDQPIGSGAQSLNVYPDGYAVNNIACSRSRIFQSVTTASAAGDGVTLSSGNYKISADLMMSPFSPDRFLQAGHVVGVFLTVINNEVVAGPENNYGVMLNVYREVELGGDPVEVAEDFEVELGDVTDVTMLAGVYNQTDLGVGDGSWWDNFSFTIGDLTEEQLAEIAACEDTSTIRFEEEFGGSEATCASDTYEWPEEAESFGGFADAIRDESLYPMSFVMGGQINFDCTTNSSSETQRVRFKFENEPFPLNIPEFFTDWVECPSEAALLTRLSEVRSVANGGGALSVDIPIRGFNETYNNFLMFLETQGGPSVTVTNVSVTSYYEAPDRTRDPDPDPAEPIPVLPLGGLLGLITLLGYMGYRRR